MHPHPDAKEGRQAEVRDQGGVVLLLRPGGGAKGRRRGLLLLLLLLSARQLPDCQRARRARRVRAVMLRQFGDDVTKDNTIYE